MQISSNNHLRLFNNLVGIVFLPFMSTQCIILAAGKNTRLDTGKPKSLLEINGISLLERHISLFSEADCQDFCIVTGHNPGPILEKIPEISRKYDVQIDAVHNERVDLENGFSVNVTRDWVESRNSEGFFLTMADHVFDRQFISSFRSALVSKPINEDLCLAVDIPSELNAHIDIDDVTRVWVEEGGHIQKIGKGIPQYNRYDTGLFYMKPRVFEVLAQCFDQGKYSISNLVTSLIQEDKATTMDVVGYLWNDVDNLNDLDNTRKLSL